MEGLSSSHIVRDSYPLRLKHALQEIHQEECPQVPNPPGCKKRASVAVILRVRQVAPQRPEYMPGKFSSKTHSFQDCLDSYFSQPWVQQGDPEVLLIKRAARTGDRWTSHIALPGGKREPGDDTDRATGIRETMEETGVDLEQDYCLYVGNLPERTITTAWGKVPLMVLCPFVYLQMRHDLPPLALQSSEVHSAHWMSLRGLLLPSLRRDVRCDVSERLTRQRAPISRIMLRALVGQFVFSAVKLKPTESLYSNPIPDDVPKIQKSTSVNSILARILPQNGSDADDRPMLLWGLTLGIMADLLELMDRPATAALWSWPTFSPWDIRAVIWLLNRSFRSQKIRELRKIPTSDDSEGGDIQIGGLDNTTYSTSIKRQRKQGSEAGVAGMILLDGYMGRLRSAVVVALLLRVVFGTTLVSYLIHKYRRRFT